VRSASPRRSFSRPQRRSVARTRPPEPPERSSPISAPCAATPSPLPGTRRSSTGFARRWAPRPGARPSPSAPSAFRGTGSATARTLRKLDQLTYGSLFHQVAEEFFRVHGAGFLSHADSLPAWRERADPFVERAFADLLEAYPLVGEAVRNVERERLRSDFGQLLDHEWGRGAARFVAAEQSFGQPDPVELALGSGSLFVRGRI